MTDAIVKHEDGGAPAPAKPTVCSVCSTEIPAGRDRCPGCGKYSDTAERCPHCNNPSPAVPYFSRSGAGCMVTMLYGLGGFPGVAYRKAHENELVCELCGGHRGFAAGPLALAAAARRGIPEKPDQAMQRAAQIEALGAGRSFGLKGLAGMLGVVGLGTLLLTLFFASGLFTALGITAAAGFLFGALALFVAGRGLKKRYQRDAEVTRLRALADLAREHQGVLRLDRAAEVLCLPPPQVEPLLSSLVDGDRVKLDVEDDGVLVYRFRDWMPPERQLPGK
ncbi:MAG: hypothetical protein JXB32_04260 [Deltaproteobacteria bacterium]|nr:hypothetical protein [Deltaproteobacteria bacterium]